MNSNDLQLSNDSNDSQEITKFHEHHIKKVPSRKKKTMALCRFSSQSLLIR